MRHADAADSRRLIIASRTAREAMDVAAGALGVSIVEIARRGRSRAQVAYARQIAIYLAHVVGQMSLSEIAVAFDRDRTTAAHACHAVEDRREGALFDRQIEALEAEMRTRVNALFDKQRLRAVVTLEEVAFARRNLCARAGGRKRAAAAGGGARPAR